MKIMMVCILCSVLLCGCKVASEQRYQEPIKDEISYPATTYLNEEMKEIATQNFILIEIGSGLETFVEQADYIVLASVISLDRADTVLADGTTSTLGYTFGKLLIQQTYKGEVLDEQVLDYVKEGGVMRAAQLDEVRCEGNKPQNISTDDTTTYINTTPLLNDIIFEEGKTYLMALSYYESTQSYHVDGYFFTTRETTLPPMKQVKKIDNVDQIQLKNNITGAYQTLNETLAEMQLK